MSTETFGWAIKQLHNGDRVARTGWNGKGMFLFYVSAGDIEHPLHTGKMLPFIAMKTATGEAVPWLASQTDVLATDWCVVP